MATDEGASVLLEAAAISYASVCEAWQARHSTLDQAGRDELRRAVAEARAQLEAAAARYAPVAANAEVLKLRVRVASLESFKRGVDEALNTGDGSYRP